MNGDSAVSAAPNRTYGERVRHPSGALGGPEENRSRLGLWILLGIALLILAWRMGWLDKLFKAVVGGGTLVKPIPNPFGWKG